MLLSLLFPFYSLWIPNPLRCVAYSQAESSHHSQTLLEISSQIYPGMYLLSDSIFHQVDNGDEPSYVTYVKTG